MLADRPSASSRSATTSRASSRRSTPRAGRSERERARGQEEEVRGRDGHSLAGSWGCVSPLSFVDRHSLSVDASDLCIALVVCALRRRLERTKARSLEPLLSLRLAARRLAADEGTTHIFASSRRSTCRGSCSRLGLAREPLVAADARRVEVGRAADDDGAVAGAGLVEVERREVIDDLCAREGESVRARERERGREEE